MLTPIGDTDPIQAYSSVLGKEIDEDELLERAAEELRERLGRPRLPLQA